MNKFSCIGRLTKDPEMNRTKGGTAVVKFGLAIETSDLIIKRLLSIVLLLIKRQK